MRGLAPPFGREPGGLAALWPATEHRGYPSRRAPRPPDPWLDPFERHPGDTALEDLESVPGPRDAVRVLIRYLAVRLAPSTGTAARGFEPDLERDAARSYLDALPREDPDRAALEPFIEASWTRLLQDDLPRRLAAATATGMRNELPRSTFALLLTGYRAARAAERFRDAAHIARQLSRLATAADAKPAARRWTLRARANEKRTTVPDSPA